MDDLLSNKEKDMLERCFNQGLLVLSKSRSYNGKIDLRKLKPYIGEGLPTYLTPETLDLDLDGNLVITCKYQGKEVAINIKLTKSDS